MRSLKDIEKIIKNSKSYDKSSDQMDKLILEGSFAVMEETVRNKSLFSKFSIFALFMRNKIAVCVTSVVIIVIVGLLVSKPETGNEIQPPKVTDVTQTPAEMMSLLSINLAYNRGGLDEVEKQYEKAVTKKVPQPRQITIAELLAESNGT